MVRSSHGGDIYRNDITYDFSINVNPLGLPERVKTVLRDGIDHWHCYPDAECERLVEKLSAVYQIPQESILCTNGAAELIFLLVQLLRPKKALLLAPSFAEYEQALIGVSCELAYFYLEESEGFSVNMELLIEALTDDLELVFFCNPNNPTGLAVEKEQVEKLAKACHQKGIFLVVDECFCEFLDCPESYSILDQIDQYENLLVLRAFTKTYAMAGLRLGYGIMGNQSLCNRLRFARQPWSVSLPAQEAGLVALEETEYLNKAKAMIREGKAYLKEHLKHMGFVVYDSQVNYLFFYDPQENRQEQLWERCNQRGILIRNCDNYKGLRVGFYRICIRTMSENRMLIETLNGITEDTKGK